MQSRFWPPPFGYSYQMATVWEEKKTAIYRNIPNNHVERSKKVTRSDAIDRIIDAILLSI